METRRYFLIGQIMVDLGFISLAQVNQARREQLLTEPDKRLLLGEVLVNLGHVTTAQVEKALRLQEEKSV